MTGPQIDELLKALQGALVTVQGTIDFSEPYHVTEFRAFRNGETVRIRILDGGPEFHAPEFRYNCEAWIEDETGRRTSQVVTGNGSSTPKEAMEIAHWYNLDVPANEGSD